MFKYNESSLVCNFTQNLLRTSYVPIIPIFSNPSEELEGIEDFPLYIYNNKIYSRKSGTDVFVDDWNLGKRYPNITANYISTHNYYSSETHEHLGEYLRAYSHFYRLDLMAFYNCYSNRLISDISLPLKDAEISEEGNSTYHRPWYTAGPSASDKYKITCFPIRPNTDYDIKIYSSVGGSITVQPIFYNSTSFLNIKINKSPLVFPVTVLPANTDLSYRLTLSGDKLKAALSNLKYLYLFVQVPTVQGDLQISVIERSPYFNTLNKRLMNLDVDYNVPFSDRLLEYLTGNVIARNDPIKQNIARIQTIITSNEFQDAYMGNSSFAKDGLHEVKAGAETEEGKPVPPYNNIFSADSNIPYVPIRGIYDDNMRVYLYNSLATHMVGDGEVPKENEIPKLYDFNGYVDKDVEQVLMRLVAKANAKAIKQGKKRSLLEEKLLEI